MTHASIRQLFAALAMGALALCVTHAQAQDFPTKPVRILTPFPVGSGPEGLLRLVADKLSRTWGKPVVVENKPGGNGFIAIDTFKRGVTDGHDLIQIDGVHLSAYPHLFKKLPYDAKADFEPLLPLFKTYFFVTVATDSPYKTVSDLMADAKANPGKLNYGSTGIGTSSHLSSFMLAKRVGFEATHIPYKGADALKDLLAGRIQFMFATIPSVMPHITAGKLKPMAVSSLKRSRSMPDVPTVVEKGFPNFEAGSWFGFFAPKGTPESVITMVNKAVNEVLQVPAIEQQMIAQGADPAGGTPAQFGQFVQREHDKWRLIVRESGARAE